VIPTSVSATSLLVSEACTERWKAENFYKTPQISSTPADVGTTCHFALEQFVKAVYLDKTIRFDDVAYLNDMYKIGYVQTFGSADYDTEEFADGAKLIADWYDRNKHGLVNTVLSCEIKEHFDIKTKAGIIPFTFIWDRCDQIDDTTYEVVDYKSLRAYVTTDQLKKKIQPRAYALAAQIKFPDAQRIWVSFDMLRHGGIVGAVFTRDENAATYRYLQRAVNRIIDTPEDETEERLNDECKWCIRKTVCETLRKATEYGGVVGASLDELIDRRHKVASAALALRYAQDELDSALLKEAESRDQVEFETDEYSVTFAARKMRKADSHAIAQIVGPEMAKKYGNFTVTNIDKMLKDKDLPDNLKQQVQNFITFTWSTPTPKITEKKDSA
jgi:hypothetical protein